jgi:hypothetical protein
VPSLERLLATGSVIVHFFDFAQLNSVRALPYLSAWHQRYAGTGLSLLAVHSPRFPFTRDAGSVAEALPGLGIGWPVALDPELAIWRDYGCEGWPSLFLWGKGGVLRWYHLGEGEYRASEEAIREALEGAGADPAGWPAPMEPLRPSDVPGARVISPTPEILPGGSLERAWRSGDGEPALQVDYEAAGAYAAIDGRGEIAVRLDGEALEPVPVSGPGLYELAADERHQRHRLQLEPSPELSVYSLQFSAGPA